MREIPLREVKEQLSRLIDAALAGETITIVSEDARAVQLMPARFGRGQPTFGGAKGVFRMADEDATAPAPEPMR